VRARADCLPSAQGDFRLEGQVIGLDGQVRQFGRIGFRIFCLGLVLSWGPFRAEKSQADSDEEFDLSPHLFLLW
jgi:hypothetical protein